jgi:hypothetical protein
MVHAAIMRLMIINIHTVAFIGDGSGPNRSAFEQLTSVAPQTVPAGSNWNDDSTQFTVAMPHPHPGRRAAGGKVCAIPDYVHDMKKSVGNMESSGTTKCKTRLIRRFDEDTKTWQYSEWQQYYAAWAQDRLIKGAGMLAPKVRREHMVRSSHTRLRVKLSAQVHSWSFALCLETWDTEGKATSTVQFMRMMDRFFDVCNSGTDRREWKTKKSRPFGGAGESDLSQPIFSCDDPRLVELTKMAEYMEEWWVSNKARGAEEGLSSATIKTTFFTREFYYDFRLRILTCRSIVGLCTYHLQHCLEGEGIALRWCNQDAVEGLFSDYRAQFTAHMGGSSLPTIIGAVRVRQTDRSALVKQNGNVTQPHDDMEAATLTAEDEASGGLAPEPHTTATRRPAKVPVTNTKRLMTRRQRRPNTKRLMTFASPAARWQRRHGSCPLALSAPSEGGKICSAQSSNNTGGFSTHGHLFLIASAGWPPPPPP